MTTTAIEIIEKEIGLLEHNLHSLKMARDILLDAATAPTQKPEEIVEDMHNKAWSTADTAILRQEWSNRKKSETVSGFDERMATRFGRTAKGCCAYRVSIDCVSRKRNRK